MKKIKSHLYCYIYILSSVVTIGAFIFANLTTISPTNYGGEMVILVYCHSSFYFHLLLFSSQ